MRFFKGRLFFCLKSFGCSFLLVMILLSCGACGVCVCVHVSSLISSLVIEHGSFFHFPRMSLFKYLGMMTVMSMFINILYFTDGEAEGWLYHHKQ